jgi:hypothetical protein
VYWKMTVSSESEELGEYRPMLHAIDKCMS